MNYSRPWMFAGLALMAAGAIMLWQQGRQPSAQAEPPKPAAGRSYQWKDLFDGKTLTGWKADAVRRRGQSLRQGRHGSSWKWAT